jgi:hypothetical protein
MNTGTDLAYALTSSLIGPHAVVPWWAWAVTLVMIFWGLLIREAEPPAVELDV